MKYYSLDKILECDALYNIIYGERSNGKTYAVLEYGLRHWVSDHQQMAIVRRWQDDFRGKRAATMFDNHAANGLIEKLTGGEWTSVYYFSGRWYLAKYDEKNNLIHEQEPFAYAFAISAYEHDKSSSYPNITTIFFDEFLTRGMTLPDEFILFMNVVSNNLIDNVISNLFSSIALMILQGKKLKNKNIKDKFVEIFKNEYYSFIIAVLSFAVSKIS